MLPMNQQDQLKPVALDISYPDLLPEGISKEESIKRQEEWLRLARESTGDSDALRDKWEDLTYQASRLDAKDACDAAQAACNACPKKDFCCDKY